MDKGELGPRTGSIGGGGTTDGPPKQKRIRLPGKGATDGGSVL